MKRIGRLLQIILWWLPVFLFLFHSFEEKALKKEATILNIEVDDVPAFVLVILIIVITSVIGGVVSAIKGK